MKFIRYSIQQNKIIKNISNAKNLLSQETLRFNQILVDLQQEKNKLQLKMEETLLLKNNLEEQLSNSSGAEENFAYKTKQLRMQIEEQAKLIQLGSKLHKWMDVFNANAKRKDIVYILSFFIFDTYNNNLYSPFLGLPSVFIGPRCI